jgi:tRNA A37 methylthiotransferase MiaB
MTQVLQRVDRVKSAQEIGLTNVTPVVHLPIQSGAVTVLQDA